MCFWPTCVRTADAAAKVLGDAGYDVSAAIVDTSSRDAVHALAERATRLGHLTGLIHSAGVSPTQASPGTILKSIFTAPLSCSTCSATSSPEMAAPS